MPNANGVGSISAAFGSVNPMQIGGLATIFSRTNCQSPFPEFLGGTPPLDTDLIVWTLQFSTFNGSGPATYTDGTRRLKGTGICNIVGVNLTAHFTFGAFTVDIVATHVLNEWTGIITATRNTTTEVHTFTVTNGPVPTWPTGIYFDLINGNDINPGTQNLPKQNIPALVSNQQYYFANGSNYNGQLAGHLQFSAANYGIGHWPTFNGGVNPAATWIATIGHVNVWQITVNLSVPLMGAGASNLFVGGRVLERVANLATCQSTPGSFVSDVVTESVPTPHTIYVHTEASGNPNTDGLLYEYSALECGVAGFDNCHFEGLYSRMAMGNNGGIVVAATSVAPGTATIVNCIAYGWGKHGIFNAGGLTQGCAAHFWQTNEFGLATSAYIWFSPNGSPSINYILDNCTAIGDSQRNHSTALIHNYGTAEGFSGGHSGDSQPMGIASMSRYGLEYGSGPWFFESSEIQQLLLDLGIWTRNTNTPIIFADNVIITRCRIITNEGWGPFSQLHDHANKNITGSDNIFATGFGSTGSTQNGFTNPGGSVDITNPALNGFSYSWFITNNATSPFIVATYLGEAVGFQHFYSDHNGYIGWTINIEGDPNVSNTWKILPGDFQVFAGLAGSNFLSFVSIATGLSTGFAPYQTATYWRDTPGDLNSVEGLVPTFVVGTDTGEFPTYVESPTSPTYSLHAGPSYLFNNVTDAPKHFAWNDFFRNTVAHGGSGNILPF